MSQTGVHNTWAQPAHTFGSGSVPEAAVPFEAVRRSAAPQEAASGLAYEQEANASGEREIWLAAHVVNRLRAPRGLGRATAT